MCFATFSFGIRLRFWKVLLDYSPLENETSQIVQKLYSFVVSDFFVHKNSYYNIVAIVEENKITNKGFGRKIGCVFVGCGNHNFNLAVKEILRTEKEVVQKVQTLMQKLVRQISAEKLREFTPL